MTHPLSQAEKFREICHAIQSYPAACDLKMSLFCVAAVRCYHQGTIIKPIPPIFTINDNVDMEGLVVVLKKIPQLSRVQEDDGDVVDFLHWLLVQQVHPQIVRVSPVDVKDILEKFNWKQRELRPTHIFRIEVPPECSAERKFGEFAEHYPTQFAFHGTKVENFQSILHFGLAQHLNKRSVFGEGIYLSTDLSVSLTYSPLSPTWAHSALGERLSCVALCEYVEHPDHFKCHKSSRKSDLPRNFIVVSNNEIIRVRFLLVYAKTPVARQANESTIGRWMVQHKATLLILCYALILLVVNVSTSSESWWWSNLQNFAKKFIPFF